MALSSPQKTLLIRIGSALVAILIVAGLYLQFGNDGLRVLSYVVVLLSIRELQRLLFAPTESNFIRAIFIFSLLVVFYGSTFHPEVSGLFLGGVFSGFCALSLLVKMESTPDSAQSRLWSIARGVLGLIYVGFLPSFVIRCLNLTHGLEWFLSLLLIVFAGDTFAYFVGLNFGKTKLLPAISPKKTREGALGGLLGSLFASFLISKWLIPGPTAPFLLMGLVVGAIGQLGDLFESLLKRAADIKDSGTLMPGHGGILDRLDGVYFSAPIMFLFAELVEKHSF